MGNGEFITFELSPFWQAALPVIARKIDEADRRVLLGFDDVPRASLPGGGIRQVVSIDVQKERIEVMQGAYV